MSRPWERLFIAAARLFAWCVVLTPFVIVAILAVATMAGRHESDAVFFHAVFFLGNLVFQLFATLGVAIVGAGVGATVGIGVALLTQELQSGGFSKAMGLSVQVLSAFPAVVFGWFGAALVLPALSNRAPSAVFAAAGIIVTMAVIPRAHLLAGRSLAQLPQSLRETAAAAGAHPARIAAHVTLPASGSRIAGIYADAFSRALGEAAAVTVVFLAAVRAGYPVSLFTIPSAILAHAKTLHVIDAGIAQSALLILALAATSKMFAARKIGRLEWV